MLAHLQTLININSGNLPVKLRLIETGAASGTMQSCDTTGVQMTTNEGTCFYPWTAIKRVRVIE